MSTLGGSRGERQAKPKFSALDINTLYRTSRGESLEPATQKSTAPRKHGMQSLGKVPSARRPPANLPSLKAETQAPGEQWSSGNGPESSGTPAAPGGDDQQPQLKPSGATLIGQAHASAAGTANKGSPGGDPRQSATWNAIGSKDPAASQTKQGPKPPLYQSSRFQHEFPSLDSSPPTSGSAKSTAPVSSSASGNDRGTDARQSPGAGGAPSSEANQNLQEVPPQFRALMPQFMYRGNGSAGGSPGFGSFGGTSSSSYNSSAQSANTPNRPRSQPGAQSNSSSGTYGDQPPARNPNYHGRGSGGGSRGGRPGPDERDQQRSMPYVEPEVALMQRPIIKEEELQRIDSIAKNEGWCKYDKIDYNQKLNFSDDESSETVAKPTTDAPKEREKSSDHPAERVTNGHWAREDRKEKQQGDNKGIQDVVSPNKLDDSHQEGRGASPNVAADPGSVFRQMADVRSYVNVRKPADKGRGDFSRPNSNAYDGKYERDGPPRDRHNSTSSGGGSVAGGQPQMERDRDGNNVYFSKQFMNNLPPRFQQSKGDRSSGPAAGQGSDRGGEKHVPFAQQFDIRYINTTAVAQQNSNVRKGIQRSVTGEDIRRPRVRIDSEEDEQRSSSGRVQRTSTGERKLSVSSEDKNHRTESWSEEPAGDLSQSLNKTDDSIASSNKEDSNASTGSGTVLMAQPKHILQRNQAITRTGEIMKIVETDPHEEAGDAEATSPEDAQKKEHGEDRSVRGKPGRLVGRGGAVGAPKTSDSRGGYTGGYGGRGGGHANWSGNGARRGGTRMGARGYNEYGPGSDTEGDEYDQEYGRRGNNFHRSSKDGKPSGGGAPTQPLEGFAPRGEPTRRGRGGSNSAAAPTGSFSRRGGGASGRSDPPKRIDNYGPPSAKSPFSSAGAPTTDSNATKEKSGLEKKAGGSSQRLYQAKSSGNSDDSYATEDKRGESRAGESQPEPAHLDVTKPESGAARGNGPAVNKAAKEDSKAVAQKGKGTPPGQVERQKSSSSVASAASMSAGSATGATLPSARPMAKLGDGGCGESSTENSTESTLPRQTNQSSSGDKVKAAEKALLEGSAPVSTIIFENTNYKQAPAPIKRQAPNCGAIGIDKKDEIYTPLDDTSSISSAMSKMIMKDSEYEFTFENELSQLTDDKLPKSSATTTQGIIPATAVPQTSGALNAQPQVQQQQMSTANMMLINNRTGGNNANGAQSAMHSASAQNNISTVELNMKIASVKKVWESAPYLAPAALLEQQPGDESPSVSGGVVNMGATANVPGSHMSSNFSSQHPSAHPMHHFASHAGNMSHVPHTFVNTSYDPTSSLEQHFNKGNAMGVDNSGASTEPDNVVGYNPSPQHGVTSNVGGIAGQVRHVDPLVAAGNKAKQGPPCVSGGPMHPTGLSPPPLPPNNQQAAPQTFYQPSAQTYGGLPTIPSPPAAMMYNSNQAPGLYHPFPIDTTRSHLSQFTGHYNTTNTAAGAQFSYMPPTATPDMYQSITSQFRLGQSPFNQSQQQQQQQIMPSSSNSLMSGAVKPPPSQPQIGAIGSKSGGAVGQPPYGQQYMYPTGPSGPHPPPQLQQSNQYYSNSGGQGTYFGNPGGPSQNYNVPAAGMFGQHGGPGPNAGPPPPQQQVASYGSQFLNITTAAALNQQYRSGPSQQMTAYMNSKQQQQQQQQQGPQQGQQPGGGAHLTQDHSSRRNDYEYFSKNYKDLSKRHQ